MIRTLSIGSAALLACLSAGTVQAHELWFQPAAVRAAGVRLTFGDSPAPGEAERVAEIAHAKVWGDGTPLEVDRRPDGLVASLPARRPVLLSAFADRGVVDYQGDSFVIQLAAYSQARPLGPGEAPKVGVDEDQLRLWLVADDAGKAVVRASWRGKPAGDAVVQIFRGQGGKPSEARTDARGEIPCPDLAAGPVSLLAVLMDKTPGRRDGKDYSHTRYKATLALAPASSISECLDRVRDVHGEAGPWAVAGYRMGERALKELGRHRQDFTLRVVHRCPAQVQFSCIADGLQAATGASPGKLNLKVEEASVGEMMTTVSDTKTGRSVRFALRPDFARSIADLPHERFEAEARRVATMPDDEIFEILPPR